MLTHRNLAANVGRRVLAVSVLAAAMAGPAAAKPFMTLREPAPAPLAFLNFCVRFPGECLIEPAPAAAPVQAVGVAKPVVDAEPVAAVSRGLARPVPKPDLGAGAPDIAVRLTIQPTARNFWAQRPPTAGPALALTSLEPAALTALRPESFALRLAFALSVAPEPTPQAQTPVAPPREAVLAHTAELMAQLQRVNRQVNGAIRRRDDWRSNGVTDHWDLPLASGARGYGDCEDYVLQKRHALVAEGVSPRALSMAIARTRRGELHAVLVVTTDQGDYVLDSLSPWVTPWSELNYGWVQRQVAGEAFRWATIETAA